MNNFDNELTWIIVTSIGLFIISLIFNIFFLINGILSLVLGAYYVFSVNKEISNVKDGIDSDLLYGYSLFLSWSVLALGIISILIYIMIQYMNRGKSVNSKNGIIKRNYINTNRNIKN
jgi:hypothetical protein